jgi:membrane-associated protease RseP (regulator of RpoE activity)
MASSAPPDAEKEIEFVRSLVARHFPVYDVRVSYDVVEFFCKVDETTLEENFETLREEMAQHSYIPMITYEKGEHRIIVGKKPPVKYRSTKVNLVMLTVTFTAVALAGLIQWASYADVPDDEFFSLSTLLAGIVVFALPLLAILGVHELGHYFMARKRKVAASLPFFIPSIPPLGTFGAFISLRDPIPNRKSLLEIGIAGPLAGLLVALPIAVLGIALTNMEARPVPDDLTADSVMLISFPYIYTFIEQLYPIQGDYLMHPTAFAAWVGFLVTALNLLPAGQLDGGHISRALFGNKAKYASWATIAILIVLSAWYFAWLIFAVLILFIGAKHPPPLNDINKLDRPRMLVGALAFVILAVAIVPIPMSVMELEPSFEVTPLDDTNATVVAGQAVIFSLLVENTGNAQNTIVLEQATVPEGWTIDFWFLSEPEGDFEEPLVCVLNYSAAETLLVRVRTSSSTMDGNWSATVRLHPEGYTAEEGYDHAVQYNFEVISPTVEYAVSDSLTIAAGDESLVFIDLVQSSLPSIPVTVLLSGTQPGIGVALYETDPATSDAVEELDLTLDRDVETTFSALVFVSEYSAPGETTMTLLVTYADTTVLTIDLVVTVV